MAPVQQMSGSRGDVLASVIAELRAADVHLGHAASQLRSADRYVLAHATAQLALTVAGFAALLQAQHERVTRRAVPPPSTREGL